MKKINIILGILFVSLFYMTGCSSSKSSSGGASSNSTLLDVLTDFSVAINENNYKKALNFIVEEEKSQILGPQMVISQDVKLKLKALRLQKLIKNKRIKLHDGKLMGIAATLPSLDHFQGSGTPEQVSDSTLINEGEASEDSEKTNSEDSGEPAVDAAEAESGEADEVSDDASEEEPALEEEPDNSEVE